MAQVDLYGDTHFVHLDPDVAIYPRTDGHVPPAQVVVPMAALHALVLAEAGRGRPRGGSAHLAHALLGVDGRQFLADVAPHPGVRLGEDGTVVVTGTGGARTDGTPREVSYSVPFHAVRSFTMGMVSDAIVASMEQLDDDGIEAIALAILPAAP